MAKTTSKWGLPCVQNWPVAHVGIIANVHFEDILLGPEAM